MNRLTSYGTSSAGRAQPLAGCPVHVSHAELVEATRRAFFGFGSNFPQADLSKIPAKARAALEAVNAQQKNVGSYYAKSVSVAGTHRMVYACVSWVPNTGLLMQTFDAQGKPVQKWYQPPLYRGHSSTDMVAGDERGHSLGYNIERQFSGFPYGFNPVGPREKVPAPVETTLRHLKGTGYDRLNLYRAQVASEDFTQTVYVYASQIEGFHYRLQAFSTEGVVLHAWDHEILCRS